VVVGVVVSSSPGGPSRRRRGAARPRLEHLSGGAAEDAGRWRAWRPRRVDGVAARPIAGAVGLEQAIPSRCAPWRPYSTRTCSRSSTACTRGCPRGRPAEVRRRPRRRLRRPGRRRTDPQRALRARPARHARRSPRPRGRARHAPPVEANRRTTRRSVQSRRRLGRHRALLAVATVRTSRRTARSPASSSWRSWWGCSRPGSCGFGAWPGTRRRSASSLGRVRQAGVPAEVPETVAAGRGRRPPTAATPRPAHGRPSMTTASWPVPSRARRDLLFRAIFRPVPACRHAWPLRRRPPEGRG